MTKRRGIQKCQKSGSGFQSLGSNMENTEKRRMFLFHTVMEATVMMQDETDQQDSAALGSATPGRAPPPPPPRAGEVRVTFGHHGSGRTARHGSGALPSRTDVGSSNGPN